MAKKSRNYLLDAWLELDNTDLPLDVQVAYDAMKAANATARDHKTDMEKMLSGYMTDYAPHDNSVPVFGHNFGKLTCNFVDASEVTKAKASTKAIKIG